MKDKALKTEDGRAAASVATESIKNAPVSIGGAAASCSSSVSSCTPVGKSMSGATASNDAVADAMNNVAVCRLNHFQYEHSAQFSDFSDDQYALPLESSAGYEGGADENIGEAGRSGQNNKYRVRVHGIRGGGMLDIIQRQCQSYA